MQMNYSSPVNTRIIYLSRVTPHQSLFVFLGIRELDESGCRPEDATEHAQHGSRPQRKPAVTRAIKVPEAGDVERIAKTTDDGRQSGLQDVDHCASQPAA